MPATKRTVLVTGGTGLVGSAIVDALPDHDVVSLSRHGAGGWASGTAARGASAASVLPALHGHVVPADALQGDNVSHVAADVTLPQLGLDDAAYEDLGRRVDVIVHSAGVSDFTMPVQSTRRINVDGTRHMIEFAERASLPIYHVSTGYVQSQGTTVNGRFGAGVYIDSKRDAEELLRASDALRAIVRPSIVFADAATGWSPSFQGLHRVIGMMLDNKVPMLPFGPDIRVDFLPRDVVGGTVADLVRDDFRGEFWLTAGPHSLSFRRITELLVDYGRSIGLEIHAPRFVSQDMIDRLLKPAGGAAVARRIDLLLALTSHFSSSPELPSSMTAEGVGDLELALMQGARFWARKQGIDPTPETPEAPEAPEVARS